jgi:phage terminase small subunit
VARQRIGLALKRQRFVDEFLVDLNGKQAAIRAGYSPHSAEAQASTLLSSPKVMGAVTQRQAQRAKKLGITQDRVLEEYRAMAMSDVRHYTMNDDGYLDLAPGAPANAMAAVSTVKRRVVYDPKTGAKIGVECEFKLWDKPGALKIVARHIDFKGATDRMEHVGKDGGPIEMMSADEKRTELRKLVTAQATTELVVGSTAAAEPAPPSDAGTDEGDE